MIGYCILIVGGTGVGKSTFARKLLNKAKPEQVLIFDPMTAKMAAAEFIGAVQFPEHYGKIVLIEDATPFFRKQQAAATIQALTLKRHRKQTFIFVFHSWRQTPPDILDFADYVTLFKTRELHKYAFDKLKHDRELLTAHTQVMNHPDRHHHLTIKRTF